jgi:hypothetical protein
VRTPETPILVWYWYRIGGVETFSERRAKLLEPVAFTALDQSERRERRAIPGSDDECLGPVSGWRGRARQLEQTFERSPKARRTFCGR